MDEKSQNSEPLTEAASQNQSENGGEISGEQAAEISNIAPDETAQNALMTQEEISEIAKYSEVLEQGDVVRLWEECEDYDKLAQTTLDTMNFIAEERLKQLMLQTRETNEKIMKMTFAGVQKHYEKKTAGLEAKYQRWIAIWAIGALVAGVCIGLAVKM